MEKTKTKPPKAQVNIKKAASTHVLKNVNKRARPSARGKHPLSIRLSPKLEEQLNKEAAQQKQSVRDYIRALIDKRLDKPVKVLEEITLKEIQVKAIAEVVENSSRATLHELSAAISRELNVVRRKSENIDPEAIAKKVYEQVHSKFENSSLEVKQIVHSQLKEIANGIVREIKSLHRFYINAISWGWGVGLFFILITSAVTVSFVHSVYPWELWQVREKLINGLHFQDVWERLPQGEKDRIYQGFRTGKY